MARLSKYNEPTEVFSVKVPASKKKEVSKLVENFLKSYLRNKNDGAEKPMLKAYKESKKIIEDTIVNNKPNSINIECGCYMDGKIMKRSKDSLCKKTKAQHNF